jgi:molybdopterin synthase sulfur carrier subunit
MASLQFAKAFRRHVDCPDEDVAGATLGEVLDAYFVRHPTVRGYVLDDQGGFRRHVTVFVDNEQVDHRNGLTAAVTPTSTIHLFQALSGG